MWGVSIMLLKDKLTSKEIEAILDDDVKVNQLLRQWQRRSKVAILDSEIAKCKAKIKQYSK